MTISPLMPAGPVQVSIGYLPADYDPTNAHIELGTFGHQLYTTGLARPKVRMTDIRQSDFRPTIDQNGFEFCENIGFRVPFALKDGDEELRDRVYAETVRLLKEKTGAAHAIVVSHTLRLALYDKVVDDAKCEDPNKRLPDQTSAQWAHVDQSYACALSSKEALIKYGSEEIADALKTRCDSRWGIINVWRPLARIQREPLACSDGRSVSDEDLRVCRMVGGAVGEVWQAVHKPGHKWYWASNMTPDEGYLIKCFDTRIDRGTTCRRCLHSAFKHPDDSGPARQSCEFRCIVFWDDQPLTEEERRFAFENTYLSS